MNHRGMKVIKITNEQIARYVCVYLNAKCKQKSTTLEQCQLDWCITHILQTQMKKMKKMKELLHFKDTAEGNAINILD